jgi:hypothetical protein
MYHFTRHVMERRGAKITREEAAANVEHLKEALRARPE